MTRLLLWVGLAAVCGIVGKLASDAWDAWQATPPLPPQRAYNAAEDTGEPLFVGGSCDGDIVEDLLRRL